MNLKARTFYSFKIWLRFRSWEMPTSSSQRRFTGQFAWSDSLESVNDKYSDSSGAFELTPWCVWSGRLRLRCGRGMTRQNHWRCALRASWHDLHWLLPCICCQVTSRTTGGDLFFPQKTSRLAAAAAAAGSVSGVSVTDVHSTLGRSCSSAR